MIRILLSGLQPDGDLPAGLAADKAEKFDDAASETSYIGGQTVGLTADGLVCGGAASQCEAIAYNAAHTIGGSNFLGILYNNSQIDIDRGFGSKGSTDIGWALPTIVYPPCKLELFRGTFHEVADALPPFDDALTFLVGDLLYITDAADVTNGRWSNVASGGNTAAVGEVLKAPADIDDSMIAIFHKVPAFMAVA